MIVLLSFDIEEFDMSFEYGRSLPLEEQLRISQQGTEIILDLLKKEGICATFFCTAQFARHKPEIIERIISDSHEVASHGYYHSQFEISHLEASRKELENISKTPVRGFRMARMMPVDTKEVAHAGYTYNSSLNPTYLPGRYNNFDKPRQMYKENGCIQLPASVTPFFRIPLFWLSFHNFPLWYYQYLCKRTIEKDRYLNIYFHPWEFVDLRDKEKYGFPSYIRRNTGELMQARFHDFIFWCKKQGFRFETISEYLKLHEE